MNYTEEQKKIDKIISKVSDLKERIYLHEYMTYLEKQNEHLWDVVGKDNKMMQSARCAVLSLMKINEE